MNRWEIEKKVAIKAIKDPAFRKRLMSDPKHALKEIDKSFDPKTINIRIVEEKQNEWVLAIPYPNKKHEKLSESDLEDLFAACGIFSGCTIG